MSLLELSDLKQEREYLNQLGIKLPFRLKPGQYRALQKIMQDKAFLAVMPTTLGKTIIAVLQSFYSVKVKHKKAAIIAPYRSLTIEHVETFSQYGLKTLLDNGSHPKNIEDYKYGDYDVVISTTEKLDATIRSFDYSKHEQKRDIIFNQLDCLIIDEIHMIEDDNRGVNLESFIMSVKYLYPHIKICGLSATIGNKEDFAEWLNAELIFIPSSERPVPLEIETREIGSYFAKQQFSDKLKILKQDLIRYKNEKVMVAVTAVGRTKEIIQKLCDIEDDEMDNLDAKHFIMNYKMCWHYSGSKGMTEKDQMAVEWGFQYDDLPDVEDYRFEYKEGTSNVVDIICRKEWLHKNYGLTEPLNLIVCTPTLIVGRNLPVSRIYVFDHEYFSYTRGNEMIPPNRLQQTCGRAGRLKFANGNPNYKGVAILMAPDKDIDQFYENAIKPFDIKSHLSEVLSEKILAWISTKMVSNKDQVFKFLNGAMDKSLKNNIELVNKKIDYLTYHKFLEIGLDGELIITNKGIETIKFYIQPETVVDWGKIVYETINLIKDHPEEFDIETFMIKCIGVDEFIQSISLINKDKDVISWYRAARSFDKPVALQALKAFLFAFPQHARDVMCTKYSKELINKNFKVPFDESRSLLTNFERLLGAMKGIYGGTSIGDKIDVCANMVSEKVFNPKMAKLMQMKGIGVTFATRLLEEGIESKEQLRDLYQKDSKKLMSILFVSVNKLKKMMQSI